MDTRGIRVLATAARRGDDYHCPACGAAVVFKHGVRVTPQFAHRPTVPCRYASEPETAAHLGMKARMYAHFRGEAWVRRCELEWVIGAYRADVWLDTAVGPVALECQVSPVAIPDLAAKLAAYTAAGVATLYLIHHGVLPSLAEGDECRIPSWLLALHALYRGRVYVAEDAGDLVPVHLAPVLRENEWSAEAPARRLKMTRRIRRGQPIQGLELRSSMVACDYGALAGGTYVLATFNDHVFWT